MAIQIAPHGTSPNKTWPDGVRLGRARHIAELGIIPNLRCAVFHARPKKHALITRPGRSGLRPTMKLTHPKRNENREEKRQQQPLKAERRAQRY